MDLNILLAYEILSFTLNDDFLGTVLSTCMHLLLVFLFIVTYVSITPLNVFPFNAEYSTFEIQLCIRGTMHLTLLISSQFLSSKV